jgi:uncharacterized membrane protein YfbV (UPF0208 family)
LHDTLSEAVIHAAVSHAIWRRALDLARVYLDRVMALSAFSPRFGPCLAALEHHFQMASAKIGRLG